MFTSPIVRKGVKGDVNKMCFKILYALASKNQSIKYRMFYLTDLKRAEFTLFRTGLGCDYYYILTSPGSQTSLTLGKGGALVIWKGAPW